MDDFSVSNKFLLNVFRALAFCEKNFAGKIGDANKLETQLDQLFVAQITHELNAYLEAMDKTR
jgi:methionyl-tRNA synthetase